MGVYKMKRTGKQMDDLFDKVESGNASGGGVTIVNDEASLDANAKLGSLAVVAKEGTAEYKKVSECATEVNMENLVNPDTRYLDVSQVVKVDGIALDLPTEPVQGVECAAAFMTEDAMITYDMFYLYVMPDSTGNIAEISLIDLLSSAQTILAKYENGAWVVEQQQVDKLNETLKNKNYYFFSLSVVAESKPLSQQELDTLDSVLQFLLRIPSSAEICIKKDVWVKPINEVKDKIDSIQTILKSKKDKPKIEEVTKLYLACENDTIYIVNLANADSISLSFYPSAQVEEYTLYLKNVTGVRLPTSSNSAKYLWANGDIPTLISDVDYELSIVATRIGEMYIYKAVLTPFM